MTDEVSPPCGEKESATGDQLFGIGQVTAKVQMGRTWVYSQVKLGLFPRPIKLGRASRWSRVQVDAVTRAYARGASLAEIATLVKSMGGAQQ